ncbi:MAG: hypothetical protein R2794_04560 [Chitinophagales bacterium]
MNWFREKHGDILLIAGCFLFLLSACKKKYESPDYSDFQNVRVKGKYAIRIPPELHADKKLNPRSEFIYADTANTSFIMLHADRIPDVQDDSIEIDLSDYTTFARTAVMHAIDDVRIIARDSSDLNGFPAYSFQFEGKVDDIPVYYILTVVQAKYYFFQIAAWTRQDLKNFNGRELYYAILSFRPAQ